MACPGGSHPQRALVGHDCHAVLLVVVPRALHARAHDADRGMPSVWHAAAWWIVATVRAGTL